MFTSFFWYKSRAAILMALILMCQGGIQMSNGSEWYERGREFQLKMYSMRTSPGRGYLWINGNDVKANGRQNETATHFKITTTADNNLNEIFIIEGANGKVIAIDPLSENIIAKTPRKNISLYTTLSEVKSKEPEIMFYPVSLGGSSYYFTSFLEGKRLILGFDQTGEPLPPSQVIPGSVQSRIYRYQL